MNTQKYLVPCLLGLFILPLVHSQGTNCVNPIQQPGYCVNIRQCQPLLNLLKQFGNSVGDFLRSSVCGYDNNDPRVCCPDTGGRQPPVNIPEPVPTPPPEPQYPPSQYGPLFHPQCGVINSTFLRVVGGVPAKLGMWPWMAVLGYTSSSHPGTPQWGCGGSLISSRHVLTAAHCVYQRKDLFLVRLGELDLDDSIYDGATPLDLRIERAAVHPQYSDVRYSSDVAVLKLERDVQFTDLIRPICLPLNDAIRQKDLTNTLPFIAGWGATQFRGLGTTRLQQLQIPVLENERCQTAFARTKALIDHRIICAGYAKGGKDACQGDSGGPFMYPLQKVFYVVGVVSYGYRCAVPGYPGVYTKVTEFLDFIQSQLN